MRFEPFEFYGLRGRRLTLGRVAPRLADLEKGASGEGAPQPILASPSATGSSAFEQVVGLLAQTQLPANVRLHRGDVRLKVTGRRSPISGALLRSEHRNQETQGL